MTEGILKFDQLNNVAFKEIIKFCISYHEDWGAMNNCQKCQSYKGVMEGDQNYLI